MDHQGGSWGFGTQPHLLFTLYCLTENSLWLAASDSCPQMFPVMMNCIPKTVISNGLFLPSVASCLVFSDSVKKSNQCTALARRGGGDVSRKANRGGDICTNSWKEIGCSSICTKRGESSKWKRMNVTLHRGLLILQTLPFLICKAKHFAVYFYYLTDFIIYGDDFRK